MRPLPRDLPVEEVRRELYRLSYHGLEQCVRILLRALGYGSVAVLSRKHPHQRTTHGGYDVVAKSETALTEDALIVQIKQYERPVSRRFVDELRGAMLRTGARHGLLITLGSFPLPAHKAASASHIAPIRLVDGAELAMLFIFKGIGVRERGDGRITVDRSFFGAVRAAYPATAPNGSTNARGGTGDGTKRRTRARKGGKMLFRTHALFAISSLWLLTPVPGAVTPDNIGLLAVTAVAGAMLPDLDAASSTVRNITIQGIRPLAPLASFVHRAWGHRGPLHSLAALPVVGISAGLLAPFWGLPLTAALWLGYASHLAADACTKSGIPSWPGRVERFHLLPKRLRFVIGSMAEDVLLPILAGSAILLLLTRSPLAA